MFGCDEVKKNIERYIDGDISAEEAERIKEHIESCASCREELEFSKSIRNALKEIKLPDPPADFLDRVYDRLNTQPTEPVRPKIFNWRSYSTIAACLLVAVFLGLNADEFSESLRPSSQITVGDSSAPPVGERDNIPEDLNFRGSPQDTQDSSASPAEEPSADSSGSGAPAQSGGDMEKTPEPEKKSGSGKSFWDILKPHSAPKQEETKIRPSDKPAQADTGSHETIKSTPAPQEAENAAGKTEPVSQEPHVYLSGQSGNEAINANGVSETPDTGNNEADDKINQGEAPATRAAPDIALSSETSENSLPGTNGVLESDGVLDSDSAKPSSGGGSPAGGGGSGGGHKKSSDGTVSVPAESLQIAKNTAAHYGSQENGIFGMTAEKFNEFLAELETSGIDYSVSFRVSGAVRFEIIAR